MGMFGIRGCPLCWDKDCNCDPKEIAAYYEQEKVVKQLKSTIDSTPYTYGAGPRGFTTQVYKGMGNCQLCDKNVWNCECRSPQFPIQTQQELDQEPGPIILASTSGDDYSVLDRVDPRIKDMAVHGQLELPGRTDEFNVYHDTKIYNTTEERLNEAAGPEVEALSPGNKHWFMKQMGFKGLGKGKWKHILFDEEIEFDLDNNTFVQLAFRIHKAGYRNAQSEYDKTGII